MKSTDTWEELREFRERGPADALCSQLQFEGVPSKVESRALENALETRYFVLVAIHLAHRARWIVAQLPPTEEELIFLATGKLPNQD
jgi:hypothetical protein